MLSSPHPRVARIAAGVLAGAVALVPLAGCTLTSNNVSCTNNSCTATLSGDGAGEHARGDPGDARMRRREHGASLGRNAQPVGDAGVPPAGESVSSAWSPEPSSVRGTTVRWMVTSVSPRPPSVISS